MLTASHCSKQMASTTNLTSYYQPVPEPRSDKTSPSPEVPFAAETSDPGWKSAIPSYIAYKWADALLAVPDVSRSNYGRIHRPTSVRTTWWNLAP